MPNTLCFKRNMGLGELQMDDSLVYPDFVRHVGIGRLTRYVERLDAVCAFRLGITEVTSPIQVVDTHLFPVLTGHRGDFDSDMLSYFETRMVH